MTLVDNIIKSLGYLVGDGVLEVDGGAGVTKYYNGDVLREVLGEHLKLKESDIKLPDEIIDLIFEVESSGGAIEELMEFLEGEGEHSKEGRWYQNTSNQVKLVLGWEHGYTGGEGELD